MLLDRYAQFDGAGTPFDYVEAVGFGRQPFCSLTVGSGMCVAGPQGVAIGMFCWVDPDTGQTNNSMSNASLLGFVLPLQNTYNMWERAFIRNCLPFPQMVVRAGVACVVASQGAFRAKFPHGGKAGDRVYTDPATGLPYSGPENDSLIPTRWTLTQGGAPGARLPMSSFVQPFNA